MTVFNGSDKITIYLHRWFWIFVAYFLEFFFPYPVLTTKFFYNVDNNKVTCLPLNNFQVEYFDVGSPLSNNFYINSIEGEVYGLDHNKERFGNPEIVMNLKPDVNIPGLFLSGK